jgi:hypothetical protein
MRKIINREVLEDLTITISDKDSDVLIWTDKIYYSDGDYEYKVRKAIAYNKAKGSSAPLSPQIRGKRQASH